MTQRFFWLILGDIGGLEPPLNILFQPLSRIPSSRSCLHICSEAPVYHSLSNIPCSHRRIQLLSVSLTKNYANVVVRNIHSYVHHCRGFTVHYIEKDRTSELVWIYPGNRVTLTINQSTIPTLLGLPIRIFISILHIIERCTYSYLLYAPSYKFIKMFSTIIHKLIYQTRRELRTFYPSWVPLHTLSILVLLCRDF